MFRGSIYFRLTPNGYIVDDFYRFNHDGHDRKQIMVTHSIKKILRVFGTFNFKPVEGQFCKRPHKLIVWSK